MPGVNGRPAENAFDDPLSGMNIDPLGRRDNVIRAPVANDMDKTIVRNVVYEPGNFIGMPFDHHPVVVIRINNTVNGSIVVDLPIIDIGLDIFQP